MEENTQEFQLVPVLDAKSNKYVIANFEAMKNAVVDYIANNVHDVEIEDDVQNKQFKNVRTDLNKKLDAVSSARIAIKKLLTEEFENQCKEIETIIEGGVKTLKTRIDEWTAKNRPVVNKVPTKTLTIKVNETTEEMKKLAKVQAFAEKLGLVVVVK